MEMCPIIQNICLLFEDQMLPYSIQGQLHPRVQVLKSFIFTCPKYINLFPSLFQGTIFTIVFHID